MDLAIAVLRLNPCIINNPKTTINYLHCLQKLSAQGNRLKERDLDSGVDNEKFDEVAEKDCRVEALLMSNYKLKDKTDIL